MKRRVARPLSSMLALALIIIALAGCGADAPTALEGTADNDILTFQSNTENKPVINIGMQYYMPDNHFVELLQKQFPEYMFVMDYDVAAGTGAESRLLDLLQHEERIDLVVSGGMPAHDLFVDLSAESFLDHYLLSALNNVSRNGHIYHLPGISSMTGIAYNTKMFAEHGWQVPANTEEFFALCETIRAQGITPFSNCLKYANQSNTMFGTMCYDQLYMAPEDSAWLYDLQHGQATYAGHMEPFYELAARFAAAGISTAADFSASLTQQRQAFWAGEYAMMFANSTIYSYAESEGAAFEVGLMPFPARDSERSGFAVTPAYYLAIPKAVEKDPERLALMKEILAYLSSEEGQKSMIEGSLSLSNVKGVDISENPAYGYIREAYERGNLYPSISFEYTDIEISELQNASIRTLFEGGGSVEDAIALMDESLKQAFAEGVPVEQYEPIATAEEDFTMLETSYYMADKLREATGADIGLMINGGYFRSNLAKLYAGEITSDLRRFVMKGVGADDYLTTCRLTGAQLRALIEHPIINEVEIDALIAASGLTIEYAPWNQRGSRVLKLTLEDGAELADDQLYTVAAWAGVIDQRYITETIRSYDTLGSITDIMAQAFIQDGTVKPNIAGRVTLVWPAAK